MKININTEALKQLNDVLHTLKPMFTDDMVTRIQDHIEVNGVTYETEDLANKTFLEFGAAYYPSETNVHEAARYPVYEFDLHYKDKPVLSVTLNLAPSDDTTYVAVTGLQVVTLD